MAHRHPRLWLGIWLSLALLGLTALACAPKAVSVKQATPEASAPKVVEKVVRETVVVEKELAARQAAPTAPPPPAAGRAAYPTASGGDASAKRDQEQDATVPRSVPQAAARMIIKNGELRLEVSDTASALDRVTQVAEDTRGYILSSRTWYEQAYEYATITIGVPADQFEDALRRLRALGLRVLDEQVAGTDVSDEYVDLESRLRNLEATEARIRSFLEQAKTVEESLRINQELANITSQIEEVKGRMNYLRDRATYSTITVHLVPLVPTATPSPTATATPTSTPTLTPTPEAWLPLDTARDASRVLVNLFQGFADIVIWAVIVLVPIALPFVALVWLVNRLRRPTARPTKPAPPAAPPAEEPEPPAKEG